MTIGNRNREELTAFSTEDLYVLRDAVLKTELPHSVLLTKLERMIQMRIVHSGLVNKTT